MRKRRLRGRAKRDLSKVSEALSRVADIIEELNSTQPERAEGDKKWTPEK